MKRTLCLPCSIEMKRISKYNIERISGGKNQKITCWWCGRRRYGADYEVSRKTPQTTQKGKEHHGTDKD